MLKAKVYIHLAYGFDAAKWRDRYAAGKIVGLNEDTPYGYGQASGKISSVAFSTDHAEGFLSYGTRLLIRLSLGFDLLHAIRNRYSISSADVVWTHTESQYLAVKMVCLIFFWRPAPQVIAQTIWLFDQWEGTGIFRKIFYKYLLNRCEIVTTHSTENAVVARKIVPSERVRVVRYGITNQFPHIARPKEIREPYEIISVGNDLDRDWETLLAAFASDMRYRITIVSSKLKLAEIPSNVSIRMVGTFSDLIQLYECASLAVVPLRHNLHASGITAIQEAIKLGVPVVTANTGGLCEYLNSEDIVYYTAGDSLSMRLAFETVVSDYPAAIRRTDEARSRLVKDGPNIPTFVQAHVDLTAELMHKKSVGR